ncbi:polysaccharide biosynthesis protein [Enterovibrio norvegicus]|uniref:polysaccharide biosynthesis protein n=1 Tax=Enterovibrio norvegicus TaxID=188144 RepID=UPI003D107B9D
MLNPIRLLLSAPRQKKRIVSVIYDALAIWLSLHVAFALRLDTLHLSFDIYQYTAFATTMLITLAVFIKLGMYRAVLRYIMVPAFANIFLGVLISSATLALSGFIYQAFIPRSIPGIYAGLAILTLGGPRVLIRAVYYHHWKRKKPNVLIYGAGSTGRDLAFALQQGNEYHPVAFIDDDPAKKGNIMLGLKVHKYSQFDNLVSLYQPIKLLLAINNIEKAERLKLVEKLSSHPIEIQSVPSLDDLATGKASIEEIQDLQISDLLGRKPVEPIDSLLTRCISGKSVLVTGAGGSIGSELCRQILKQKPNTLVLFELNEFNLYNIERELEQLASLASEETKIHAVLGSVQNMPLLTKIMKQCKTETVYHAAAYKHVPIVEHNIIEGVRNNVFGTWYSAEAAMNSGVRDFVLVSTDKAVRPTNVMGASKRLAELVLQAAADRQNKTKFSIVRFGNVLDSSGSVVPLFREQIRRGGPVTVTHPDITRYFMIIPEAAELVIQAGSLGKNGQVFVLDMGDPVKILDLAKRMIHLMGQKEKITSECLQTGERTSFGDIEVKFTGLRPGEKLYEELLIGNNVEGTIHPKIMTALEVKLEWDEMNTLLDALNKYCENFDVVNVVNLMRSAPLAFYPEKEPIGMFEFNDQLLKATPIKTLH